VPIGQEVGWASEPVWTQRLEKKNVFNSAGNRTPVVQSVVKTILTELPQLLQGPSIFHICLRVITFIPVSIFPPLPHIHSCIIWGTDSVPVRGSSSTET
jgi:hypothetical protein